MASPYTPGVERKYAWQVGDRVQRTQSVWSQEKQQYVDKLFRGHVSAVYCGIPVGYGHFETGRYYELYEVTWDEPFYPEIYQGDRQVQRGFFDYGLSKEEVSDN